MEGALCVCDRHGPLLRASQKGQDARPKHDQGAPRRTAAPLRRRLAAARRAGRRLPPPAVPRHRPSRTQAIPYTEVREVRAVLGERLLCVGCERRLYKFAFRNRSAPADASLNKLGALLGRSSHPRARALGPGALPTSTSTPQHSDACELWAANLVQLITAAGCAVEGFLDMPPDWEGDAARRDEQSSEGPDGVRRVRISEGS